MAGYQQGEIDQYAPGVTPQDVSFLNYALSTKEGQYEKGLSQVKTMYNSVLSAPLTNPQNQQARDQYMSDAQNNIKALSKADLSLPQNVQQAGKIFAPFYEDPDIVHDIYTTKSVQANNQQINTWKNSKDKDEFSKYNPIQEEYNNQTLLDLQRASRGDGSISNISARKTIPYKDKMEYLRKAADDSGYEIEYDYTTDANGRTSPYIKKVTNGAETIPNWKVWADATLGDNFQEQDRMFGQVAVDRYKNHLLQQNPSLKDADINHAIANDIIPEYADFYKQKFEGYKSTIDNYDARLKELTDQAVDKNGNQRKLTPTEQQYFNQYTQQKSVVSGLQKKLINDNPDIYNNERNKIVTNIEKNPVQYFTDLEHNRAITNFANGVTALSSVKLEPNSVWATEQSNSLQRDKMKQDWKLSMLGLQLNERQLLEKGVADGVMDKDGNWIAPGTNPILSKDTTDVTKLPTFTERFKQDQSELYSQAVNKIFDYQGVAGVLANKTIGLTSDEIMKFCQATKKLAHPEISGLADDDKTIIQNVRQRLTNAGINVDGSAEGFAKGLELLAQKESKRKDLTAVEKKRVDDNVLASGIQAQTAFDQYKANQTEFKNLFQKELETNPDLQKHVIYRGEDGSTLPRGAQILIPKSKDGSLTVNGIKYTPDIVGTKDVMKFLPNSIHTESGGVLTSQDLADAYTDNKLHIEYKTNDNRPGTVDYTMYIGDKKYRINSDTYDYLDKATSNIYKAVGSPQEMQKITKDLNEKVTGNMSQYKGKTGEYGTVQSYYSSNKPQKQFVMQVSQELSQPSNQLEVYTTDKSHSPVEDANLRQAIQLALSSGEYTAKVAYHDKSFNGQPQWEVQFDQPEGQKSEKVAKFGNVSTDKLLGQSFLITTDPATNSKLLSSYPHNTGPQRNQSVLDGYSKEVSPYLSANGFQATMTPNKEDPDYVVVNGTSMERNPHTGNLQPKAFEHVQYLKGQNAKTIDEIHDFYIRAGLQKYNQNNLNLKTYNQNYQ